MLVCQMAHDTTVPMSLGRRWHAEEASQYQIGIKVKTLQQNKRRRHSPGIHTKLALKLKVN